MKRKITLIALLVCAQFLCFGQKAKKTSFMVMPSDNWMTQNKFYTEIDNQGEMVPVFNYKKAILQSEDLLPVIAKIEGLLKDRGLLLKNLESVMNSNSADNAENLVLTSKTSGAGVSESAFDKLMKTAKADILVKISWKNTKVGPRNQITFTLEGIDAYSNEPVASISGTGKPSIEAILPVLLEEAVLTHIDSFLEKIAAHAEDTFENGRRVKIVIKKWDSWDGDLEKEYGGKELNEILEAWFRGNAVKGVFEIESSTENKMTVGVKIPVFDETGNGLSAQNFLRPLNKLLKAPPYSIPNKLMEYGLGKAQIVLGDK